MINSYYRRMYRCTGVGVCTGVCTGACTGVCTRLRLFHLLQQISHDNRVPVLVASFNNTISFVRILMFVFVHFDDGEVFVGQ